MDKIQIANLIYEFIMELSVSCRSCESEVFLEDSISYKDVENFVKIHWKD